MNERCDLNVAQSGFSQQADELCLLLNAESPGLVLQAVARPDFHNPDSPGKIFH
jgi:hypothetical protein